jgi:ABC-2 type transport system ATP-binding protein
MPSLPQNDLPVEDADHQPPSALRVRALSRLYAGRAALENVDLDVSDGESFGMVGENGAGKTTLIKCSLDLCLPSAGTVEIYGRSARHPEARRALAYHPERFVPPHYLLGREFLETTTAVCGDAYRPAAVARLLAELDLEATALSRPVRQYSKGMMQKLGLIACFMLDRRMYILDEPMSGLDPGSRVAVKSILKRLRDSGKTIFFTSHVLADVEEICSAIAVVHEGRIKFRGDPSELRDMHGEANLEHAFLKCIRS